MATLKEFKELIKAKAVELRTLKATLRKSYTDPSIKTHPSTLQYALYCQKKDARLKHIAYSLMRGRTYEQIEKHTKEPLKDNDWTTIQEVQHEYEDVRACAA